MRERRSFGLKKTGLIDLLNRIWTGDAKLFIFEMKACDRYPRGQNQKYHHGPAPGLQKAELRSDRGPKDWIWRQSCCQANSSLHEFIFKDGALFPSLGACQPPWWVKRSKIDQDLQFLVNCHTDQDRQYLDLISGLSKKTRRKLSAL